MTTSFMKIAINLAVAAKPISSTVKSARTSLSGGLANSAIGLRSSNNTVRNTVYDRLTSEAYQARIQDAATSTSAL